MIKNMKLIILFIGLSGCAIQKGIDGKQGIPGPKGSPGDNAPILESFQDFYLFPNNGYIDIIEDNGKQLDLTQIRLIIQNIDNTYGILPVSSISNLPTIKNKVYYFNNLVYNNVNNIKTDIGAGILTGAFFTMLTLKKVNKKLIIHIEISSGAFVVFNRTITQE